MTVPRDPAEPPRRNRALRLTFSYEGAEVRLASQQRVEMTTPASDPVHDYEGQTGFWFELRDAQRRVLYRRVIHTPLRFDIEAPSGDPVRPFTRIPVKAPEGSFVLTAPDLDGAEALVLFATVPPGSGTPAKEIARIPLRQTPGRKEG